MGLPSNLDQPWQWHEGDMATGQQKRSLSFFVQQIFINFSDGILAVLSCCRLLASILLDVLHCSPRKKPIIHYQFEKQDLCQRPSSRHVNLNLWMCIAPGNVKLGDCRFLAQGMLSVFVGLLVSCVVGRLVLRRIAG